MAQLSIRLNTRPREGRMFVYVALRSDEDATPTEHEQDHRRLLRTLLPCLSLDNESGPKFVIAREKPQAEPMVGGCCGDGDGYEVIDIG